MRGFVPVGTEREVDYLQLARLGICSPTDKSPECRPKNRSAEKRSAKEWVAPNLAPAPVAAQEPEGVAGFRFGADQARVREVCEGSKHQFDATEQAATCSGMAAKLGVPGRASMVFCNGGLCEIEVTFELETESYNRVLTSLRKQLTDRYGVPAQASLRSSDCRGGLKNCVLDVWRWPSRHSVILTTGVLDAKPALLLTYSTPERLDTSSPGPAL